MNTLYISDLDGTLLNKKASLSPYTIETINGLIKEGLSFSVATARSEATVKKILEPLNLTLPIVLMNGAAIFDLKEKKYIHVNYLTKDAFDYAFTIIKKSGLSGFLYEIKENVLCTYYKELYNQALKDFYEERVTLYNKNFVQVEDLQKIKAEHTIYITLMDTPERLTPIYEELKKHPGLSFAFYHDIYAKDNTWYLEIFSVHATKYNAVMYLRNTFHFDKLVGFGDNTNDLPLFKACNTTCAVSNAKEEVKAIADFIIESNEENGVANYIRSHYHDTSKNL